MNELQISIGRHLAMEAVAKRLTTYQELGRAVHWPHPTGRGLGRHLYEVLKFTHDTGLPCLTSIVCKGGTSSPGEDALAHIWNEYGKFNVRQEQERVFAYDWTSVSEFTFEQSDDPAIDDDRFKFSDVCEAPLVEPRSGTGRRKSRVGMGGAKCDRARFR